ncbi:hypothetical protein [Streptomyces sp. NPDC059744]|uniref:hypothetical protein n=1 Tax=Streptomyces sp. NPDC059744 TaxID=3346929 RepID=UPI003669FACF
MTVPTALVHGVVGVVARRVVIVVRGRVVVRSTGPVTVAAADGRFVAGGGPVSEVVGVAARKGVADVAAGDVVGSVDVDIFNRL